MISTDKAGVQFPDSEMGSILLLLTRRIGLPQQIPPSPLIDVEQHGGCHFFCSIGHGRVELRCYSQSFVGQTYPVSNSLGLPVNLIFDLTE
jgi:hypothetical protein